MFLISYFITFVILQEVLKFSSMQEQRTFSNFFKLNRSNGSNSIPMTTTGISPVSGNTSVPNPPPPPRCDLTTPTDLPTVFEMPLINSFPDHPALTVLPLPDSPHQPVQKGPFWF